jgi:hypothetical protein
VSGLAGFEQKVLNDLWRSIQMEFPPPPPPPSELEKERALHQHIVDERSRGFIGRQGLVQDLIRFAELGKLVFGLLNPDATPTLAIPAAPQPPASTALTTAGAGTASKRGSMVPSQPMGWLR